MKKLHLFRLLFCALLVSAFAGFAGCSESKDDEVELPTLEVTPATIAFDENGGSKTFTINTTGKWTITGMDGVTWIALTPPQLSGNGSNTITVTAGQSAEAHSVTLKVKVFASIYGIEKEVDSKNITITQTPGGEQPSEELIYGNNFDKAVATKTFGSKKDSWPFLDQFDGWQNQTGTGASTVTYTYKNMSVRQSGKLSGGYDGASGQNKIFFGGSPATFDIGNITLPAGKTNFKLVFGGSYSVNNNGTYDNIFKPESFLVTLGDGTVWSGKVTYEKIGGSDTTDPFWVYYAANFTLKTAVDKLSIRFTANLPSGFAIDDVKLTEGLGGQQIVFGGDEPGGETKTVTIPEMIGKMTAEQVVLDAASDCVFEAVVITNKEGGNFNKDNLLLMTPGATAEKNGITLYGSGKYTNPADPAFTFAYGDKVKVTLKAGLAKIINYNGLYEVTGAKDAEWVVVEKIGTTAASPIIITADKLAVYQGMPVMIEDVTSPATAAVWSTTGESGFGLHTFKVGGADVNVFVQANMPGLVGTEFSPSVTGDIIGYATVHQDKAQICPQVPGDVEAFRNFEPTISVVNPSSLAFVAEGEMKTVTVTTVNADGYTITATAEAPFVAEVNGDVVSVTAPANATGAAISKTLTINLEKDGTVADTKTVALAQAKKITGDVTEIVADFSVAANYPDAFPKLSANKTVDAQTFSFGGHDYTFAGSGKDGYYQAFDKEVPYVINGKSGAYIELPAVEGKSLTSVTLTTREGASKSVMVGIYDSENNAVAGGEAIKLDQAEGKMEYTYDLTATAASTKYRIYIASAHNAQFVNLKMSYN